MNTVLQHNEDSPQGAAAPPYYATILSDGTYILQVTVPVPDYYSDATFLQRYAADGTLIGDPVDIHAYVQDDGIRVLALASGYVVIDTRTIAGFEGYYQADYMQVFTADGVALGPQVQITQYGAAGISDIDQLDSGSLLFSYAYGTVGFAAVYDQAGSQLHLESFRTVTAPVATAVDGGGFAEVWRGIDGKNHGQFFTATGSPVAPAFIVGGAANAIATRTGGGFIMSWVNVNSVTPNYDARLMVQVYDSAGHAVSAAVDAGHVGNQGGINARIAALSDGGFVVVWENVKPGDGDGSGIFALRFDNVGHALGSAFRVNVSIAGEQRLQDVVATADGGFTVGWHGQGAEGPDFYHSVFSTTADMSGANLLYGTLGNDSLDGRQGADTMAGGVGNDTYYVDNAGDQVQDLAGAGTDWVYSLVTYTLPTDVEILTLRGTADLDGYGNALNNTIAGNAGANHLYGGAGNDDLRGLAGNDTINGNSGADKMSGGAGDDLYYADNAGDRAIEASAGDGVDTVRTSVDFALGAYVENLALVGTENLRGFGNELNNTLTGNNGANILRGLGGNDRIDGGAGADSLIGGTGDDTYYVDNAGDKVYESAGEGTDRVYSSVTFAVNSQSIESVILTGSANINAAGGAVADQLTGNGGANILTGNAGNDSLNGGAGSDTLIGGAGSDVFAFSLASGADAISDFLTLDNDHIDLHAYSAGVVNGGGITVTQWGLDTIIDLGGGNVITVVHATADDVNSHIIW